MANENAQREIEERLGRVESPPPPPDLLDRIRGDIPGHLRPRSGDSGAEPGGEPAARRPIYRLLAASLAVAALGGLLAYRVFREAPPPDEMFVPATPEVTPPQLPDRVAEPPAVGTETLEVGPTASPADALAPAPAPEAPAPEALVVEVPVAEVPVAEVPVQVPAAPEPLPSTGVVAEEEIKKAEIGTANEIAAHGEDAGGAGRPATTEVGERRAQRDERDDLDALRAQAKRVEQQLREAAPESAPPPPPPPGSPPPPSDAYRSGASQVEAGAPAAGRLRARGIAPGEPAPPSTGGTTEPNDQPYGDMFFRAWGTNPFVDTEDDPQSTFGLDVDTGSYTLARSYLERGHLPPPEAIRVEEFINYFDYRDPAPRRGEFTLSAEGAPSPWARGPRYELLRIGIRGREIHPGERRDATLVFVVDVSGSMARENRIGLVKQALHLLLDQLGPRDRVGLVVYGSRGQVLLAPSGDLERVRWAIERLTTGGSTNAEEGLVLAYDLMRRHFRPGAINRIVLCSDGVANVGRTGPESILERIGREAEEGIELTTVGFGMGNYNDVLMEQLADRGDGNYAYVDTLAEARRVFVENLTGTLQTLAADAKVQVEFDPRVVSRYRLLGYENRDVADHRFRDDTVDAGEIGAGHTVTALYEVKLAEDALRRRALGEVRLRYRSKETGRVVEEALALERSLLARSWRAASPSLRLAAVAAELGELLKRSYWARENDPRALLHRAEELRHLFPGDRDVAELVELVGRAVPHLERELERDE